MYHRDLGMKFVGYLVTKVWLMQSADQCGVVMMHLMSVSAYKHWLINNASETKTICMLAFVKDIPNALIGSYENKF
jgi:hypothetical protein